MSQQSKTKSCVSKRRELHKMNDRLTSVKVNNLYVFQNGLIKHTSTVLMWHLLFPPPQITINTDNVVFIIWEEQVLVQSRVAHLNILFIILKAMPSYIIMCYHYIIMCYLTAQLKQALWKCLLPTVTVSPSMMGPEHRTHSSATDLMHDSMTAW